MAEDSILAVEQKTAILINKSLLPDDVAERL
jgi:hypothetical protein